MKVKVQYLAGKSTLSEWSGVYGYKPDDSDEIEFFSVMRIKADTEELSLDMVAKMLFDELQSSFFDENNLEKDLVLRLETSAWKMKSKMDLILSREQEIVQKGLDIEMAVAIIYQDYLYIGVIGESKIFIKRGDELVELSKVLVDGDMSGFLKSGSLELEELDRLFLSTSKTVEEFGTEVGEVIDNLGINYLENSKELSGVAGILIADQNDNWGPETLTSDNVEEEILEDEVATSEISFSQEREEVLEDEEEYYEGEGVGLKERISVIALGIRTKGLEVIDTIRNLRAKDNQDYDEEDDAQRFTNISQEEDMDEEEYEPELKEKILDRVSVLASTTKDRWNKNIKPLLQNNQKTYMKVLKSLFFKISQVIKNVYLYLKSELVGTGDRRDYLKSKSRSRNRKIALIVVLVAVLFLYFGLRNAEANRIEQEKIDTARRNVDDLKSRYQNLATQINQVRSESDDRKNLLITEFTKLDTDIDNQKKSNMFVDELDQIQGNIQLKQDELLLIEAFTQPSIVTDVGKTFPDANLTDMVYSNGAVFISDSSRNVIYKVSSTSLDNRPEPYVTNLVQPYLLVKDAEGNIVFYDNDATSSLGKFGHNQPNLTRFGQLTPANIGKPTESVIYDGNNSLYELKAINRQIFKRDQSGDTYVNGGAAVSTDPSTNWRTDSDYSNGIDIAAPYEIYVLISGQGVKRYFARGENTITFDTYNNFLRKDFDSLSKATALDVTGRYMAVGDPINKRVLLFQIEDNETKEITFIKQFVYRGKENVFSDIKELSINEQDRSVYVLDASKVIKLQF